MEITNKKILLLSLGVKIILNFLFQLFGASEIDCKLANAADWGGLQGL